MNPQKNPNPQGAPRNEPGKPQNPPTSHDKGDAQRSSPENRKNAPRYDDRPDTSRTGTANVSPDKPKQKSDLAGQTPTTLEQATGDPMRTTPKTAPRYGDQEGDDPRRGTVEAGGSEDASVEGSDKSGR